MAAFKSFINTIDMNLAGLLPNSEPKRKRNRSENGQLVHGTLHKSISTIAALSQNPVKVNNMKILNTTIIFARGMTM